MFDNEHEEFEALPITDRMEMVEQWNDEHEAVYQRVKAKTETLDNSMRCP